MAESKRSVKRRILESASSGWTFEVTEFAKMDIDWKPVSRKSANLITGDPRIIAAAIRNAYPDPIFDPGVLVWTEGYKYGDIILCIDGREPNDSNWDYDAVAFCNVICPNGKTFSELEPRKNDEDMEMYRELKELLKLCGYRNGN